MTVGLCVGWFMFVVKMNRSSYPVKTEIISNSLTNSENLFNFSVLNFIYNMNRNWIWTLFSDLWFWFGSCCGSGSWSYRFSYRIRGHTMVSCTRNHVEFQGMDNFSHQNLENFEEGIKKLLKKSNSTIKLINVFKV